MATSTLVTVDLTVAGDAETYDDAQQAALRAALAAVLRCYPPACFLSITLGAPGSVRLTVTLAVPDEAVGATVAMQPPPETYQSVAPTGAALVAGPPAALSDELGIAVEAVVPSVTTTKGQVPLVVSAIDAGGVSNDGIVAGQADGGEGRQLLQVVAAALGVVAVIAAAALGVRRLRERAARQKAGGGGGGGSSATRGAGGGGGGGGGSRVVTVEVQQYGAFSAAGGGGATAAAGATCQAAAAAIADESVNADWRHSQVHGRASERRWSSAIGGVRASRSSFRTARSSAASSAPAVPDGQKQDLPVVMNPAEEMEYL